MEFGKLNNFVRVRVREKEKERELSRKQCELKKNNYESFNLKY